jgi:hypothetical protein
MGNHASHKSKNKPPKHPVLTQEQYNQKMCKRVEQGKEPMNSWFAKQKKIYEKKLGRNFTVCEFQKHIMKHPPNIPKYSIVMPGPKPVYYGGLQRQLKSPLRKIPKYSKGLMKKKRKAVVKKTRVSNKKKKKSKKSS